MALIKCPSCGNDVSSKAKACPKCGHLNSGTSTPASTGGAGQELRVIEVASTTQRQFYLVGNDGKPIGPYPEVEIRNKVAMGELSTASLCITKGMLRWQPIRELITEVESKPQLPFPVSTEPQLVESGNTSTASVGAFQRIHKLLVEHPVIIIGGVVLVMIFGALVLDSLANKWREGRINAMNYQSSEIADMKRRVRNENQNTNQYEGLNNRQLDDGGGISNASSTMQRIVFPPDASHYTLTCDLKRSVPNLFLIGIMNKQHLLLARSGNVTIAVSDQSRIPFVPLTLNDGRLDYPIRQTADYIITLVGEGRVIVEIEIPPLDNQTQTQPATPAMPGNTEVGNYDRK